MNLLLDAKLQPYYLMLPPLRAASQKFRMKVGQPWDTSRKRKVFLTCSRKERKK